MEEKFGEDYFERGIAKNVSCYEDYHWMPVETIRAAHFIIYALGLNNGDRVMDFGCAKGFYVKALRALDIEAYGMDVSSYALSQAPSDVRPYLIQMGSPTDFLGFLMAECSWIMSKDVLEHMTEEELEQFLETSSRHFPNSFHIIPLAIEEGGDFICQENEVDKTHLLRHTAQWWIQKFYEHGWILRSYSLRIHGLKERHLRTSPYGHGFFILERH
jgi:cyclopropane fatty-acyl-phospholipid synthase-like methyltransferase